MKKLLYIALTIVACIAFTGCKWFDKIVKPEPAGPDELNYSELVWDKGGIDGSKAQLTAAIVGNLKMDSKGLSYKWVENDLGVWGLAKTDASARTCVFYKKDGKWHGGFYEWISTSRTTREWSNIKGKYKGWNWADIPNGSEAAFVIISKDGKKRTNVLKGTWSK